MFDMKILVAHRVSINVANVADLFGLGELTNPEEVHSGYDNDERVISIIAAGVGRQGTTNGRPGHHRVDQTGSKKLLQTLQRN